MSVCMTPAGVQVSLCMPPAGVNTLHARFLQESNISMYDSYRSHTSMYDSCRSKVYQYV